MANDYMATMGQIATVCRRIAGGRDINGYLIPGANLWDIGPLVAELQRLLDEYDQQMLEASRRNDPPVEPERFPHKACTNPGLCQREGFCHDPWNCGA